jgi:hypothetical protein
VSEPVYDTRADVEWDGVDPADWRDLPDDGDEDDDEDLPAEQWLIDVLGFDPDEI